MDENLLALIVSVGGGVFCITASIFNWDWFFENRKARFFVTLFKRTGARIFYTLLGGFLIYIGIRIL